MLINVTLSAASSTDRPVSEAGGVLDLGINGVPPGALFDLMCRTSVVELSALVGKNAADL
jgi:hypothetical protein